MNGWINKSGISIQTRATYFLVWPYGWISVARRFLHSSVSASAVDVYHLFFFRSHTHRAERFSLVLTGVLWVYFSLVDSLIFPPTCSVSKGSRSSWWDWSESKEPSYLESNTFFWIAIVLPELRPYLFSHPKKNQQIFVVFLLDKVSVCITRHFSSGRVVKSERWNVEQISRKRCLSPSIRFLEPALIAGTRKIESKKFQLDFRLEFRFFLFVVFLFYF